MFCLFFLVLKKIFLDPKNESFGPQTLLFSVLSLSSGSLPRFEPCFACFLFLKEKFKLGLVPNSPQFETPLQPWVPRPAAVNGFVQRHENKKCSFSPGVRSCWTCGSSVVRGLRYEPPRRRFEPRRKAFFAFCIFQFSGSNRRVGGS